jgi:hypothetical protein
MIASTKCLRQKKLVHFNSKPIGHCRHFVKRTGFSTLEREDQCC